MTVNVMAILGVGFLFLGIGGLAIEKNPWAIGLLFVASACFYLDAKLWPTITYTKKETK
jgi:hypothetical protein